MATHFQIVVAGSGRLSGHAVQPVAVHYSNAYGPIAAGPAGLQYFILCHGYDTGARYLPTAREEVPGVRRQFRDAFAEPATALTAAPEAAATNCLLPPAADGMGAWRYRIPSSSRLAGADSATGDGQFWVLTAGSLQSPDGQALSPLSCAFVGPEAPLFEAMPRRPG